jgi:putative cell wall-binding protein
MTILPRQNRIILPAVSSVSVRRLSGGDRFETAAKIAEAAFPDGASEAVLVSGQAFPDALSATAYAGAKGCPVLITMPGYLSNATKSLISELGIRSVTVIGGKSAVSDNVLSTLSQMGVSYVRIFGNDRFRDSGKGL